MIRDDETHVRHSQTEPLVDFDKLVNLGLMVITADFSIILAHVRVGNLLVSVRRKLIHVKVKDQKTQHMPANFYTD